MKKNIIKVIKSNRINKTIKSIRNIKINKSNRFTRCGIVILSLLLPNFAFAGSSTTLESVVDNIVSFSQGTVVKSICVLIILGIAIYMAKNHDRLKEISVMCITIIVALMIFMNASSIADFLFD